MLGMLADIGIPLIGFTICLGWFTVIPVSLVETVIAMRVLRWPFLFAVQWVTVANLFTMLLGIPLTWFVVTLLTAFTGGGGWGHGSIDGVLKSRGWLGPGYVGDMAWAVPLGLIVLCVPFFLMSWWLEYVFLCAFVARGNRDARISLRDYAWKANFASYVLLVALLIGAMIWP